MHVIAIDPAPGKPSTIFDGAGFVSKPASELRSYLRELCIHTPETLLCWDAPLTGPAVPSSAGKRGGDFTQRPIEGFFRTARTGFNTPKGISVLGYSGCQHWTITRSLLGLPRTGPYDKSFQQLPFRLLPAPDDERSDRPSVVEIHPAVAAWLWSKEQRRGKPAWNYKKDDEIRNEMWEIVLKGSGFPWGDRPTPKNDDQFDAAVGYILGELFLQDREKAEDERRVDHLGDRSSGSFLLPVVPELVERWRTWTGDS